MPQKKETHRVRLKVGGDKLNFDGTVSTQTSDLTTSKLHWNSVISTLGAKYLVFDIKKFYLYNPMSKQEYYMIAISLIPQDIIDNYNLVDQKTNGFLYVRAEKGMYGLVKAGIIVHMTLK